MLIRTVYKTLGSWSSDGDGGRWLGLHVEFGCVDRTLLWSLTFPRESAPMGMQAQSTCFCDGTDIINGLPSDTLGGLIIGGDFNSHLSRDAEQRGTCGAHGLPTPTSGKGWLLEE